MGTMDNLPPAGEQGQCAPEPGQCAEAAPTAPSPKPSLASRFWNGWIKPVGLAVLLVVTLRSSIADWNDVPSQSMEPTILVGDRIFVNKLAYDLKMPFTTLHLAHWGDPKHGDIIVFFSPTDGKRMVKRVIGVPGDTIAMRDNQVLINGAAVDYKPVVETHFDTSDLSDPAPYSFAIEMLGHSAHAMMLQPMRLARRDFHPQQVPRDMYFVLGDNRDNSGDSRIFGFVTRDQIVGKATALAFSLDTTRGYTPRWERFFRGLD